MRGYERDEYEEYENLDEYEEEGEEDEAGEEEYEEEESPQPELLEYLELRQRLKDDIRKQRKKELGTANGLSRKITVLPRDNYGSFFGPSQPVIAERVIQESKSLLENPNLAAKVMKSNHANNRSSTSKPAVSKSATSSLAPKVTNGMKTKVQMLKNTRDYSFLLSDDAELPAPSKGPLPHKVSAPSADARLAQPPKSKQSSSNTGRNLINGREVRKPIPGSSQMQPNASTQRSVSISKPTQPALDSRKQLISSNSGSGPGRPLGQKAVPPKINGVSNEKRGFTQGAKSTVPAFHKPTPSKLQPSIPRQSLVQKKETPQSGRSTVMSKQAKPFSKPQQVMQKQAVSSSKSQIKQVPSKTITRPLEDRDRVKKARRPDAPEAISIIRNMFRYNPNSYRDEDDTSDMEANFDEIQKEEKRSAKIARKEDEEELRKIEEEERRERLRKKRKLSHH